MRRAALALAALQFVPSSGGDPVLPAYPFGVGESFTYDAKLGVLTLGTASMAVTGLDTVRGVESFVFRFALEGGTFFFKLNDVMQSWTGRADFISRRFHQDFDEDGKLRQRYFEIYPDSGIARQLQRDRVVETPAQPLDDASFFYFVRTTSLAVGQTYTYDRYFRKQMNPVVIKVLKREKLEMPDGRKVDCFVLQPLVGDDGIFGPRAEARLWLTDDARRIPVQIRSRLSFGTVTLRLSGLTLAPLGADSAAH